VHAPKILFADEPTGNLDQTTGRAVGDLLFAMNQARATTLVLATHDLALAARCDRMARLQGGRAIVTTAS
jgi:putative ABC transport system ATP-binding protein